MDANKIKKASKIIDEIKSLSQDFQRIEELALLVSNKETSNVIKLQISDIEAKEDEKSKVGFDDDGSLAKRGSSLFFSSYMSQFISCDFGRGVAKNKKPKHKLEINTRSTLKLFAIMLEENKHEQMKLISKLEKLGVKYQ